MKLVTIVLNWNGATDTLALLDTLVRCHAPEGWTLATLVVDNGSTDGSAERIAAAFPEVELLRLSENLRFAGGNNAGLRRALAEGADAIMLLNNDTEADPDLYEHLVRALEQDPAAGAVAPLIYYGAPSDRIWYAGGIVRLGLGLVLHRGLGRRDHGQYREVETTEYLTGCCLLARREVWERIGLLDERYFIYAEDADWSLRVRGAGKRLLFVPAARLWHKVSATAGGNSPWKLYHRERANLMLFDRHARGLARLTWIPCHALTSLATMTVLVLRGHARAAWAVPRAAVDAMRGRRERWEVA